MVSTKDSLEGDSGFESSCRLFLFLEASSLQHILWSWTLSSRGQQCAEKRIRAVMSSDIDARLKCCICLIGF